MFSTCYLYATLQQATMCQEFLMITLIHLGSEIRFRILIEMTNTFSYCTVS